MVNQNPYGLGGAGTFKPQRPPAQQPSVQQARPNPALGGSIYSGAKTPALPGAGQVGTGFGKPLTQIPGVYGGGMDFSKNAGSGPLPQMPAMGQMYGQLGQAAPASQMTVNPFMPQFQRPQPQPQQVPANPYSPYQNNWDWNQSGRFPGGRFPSY